MLDQSSLCRFSVPLSRTGQLTEWSIFNETCSGNSFLVLLRDEVSFRHNVDYHAEGLSFLLFPSRPPQCQQVNKSRAQNGQLERRMSLYQS